MEKEDFIEMFEVAFPERPKDRIQKLAVQLANQDGRICELLFVTTVLAKAVQNRSPIDIWLQESVLNPICF